VGVFCRVEFMGIDEDECSSYRSHKMKVNGCVS
jgi:hypothetical protein